VSQENVEIVRSMYTAFAQRDGVTPFKHYAPDIEWEHGDAGLVGSSPVYHGHDGVHALFRIFSRPFASLSFEWWS
jgi:ketosteroid isomerase-like protein